MFKRHVLYPTERKRVGGKERGREEKEGVGREREWEGERFLKENLRNL